MGLLNKYARIMGVRIDVAGLLFHTIPVAWLTFVLPDLFIIIIALMYITYQIIDYITGEVPEEVQGDLIEFMTGLVIGHILRVVL